MSTRRNEFFDLGISEESDLDDGYDSEAAELSKGARASAVLGRSTKRRKLSYSEDEDRQNTAQTATELDVGTSEHEDNVDDDNDDRAVGEELLDEVDEQQDGTNETSRQETSTKVTSSGSFKAASETNAKSKTKQKDSQPGVIYLSSLPPYLKPSALRNLLMQRGFSPITRLFLTPASKAKSTSKKNSRQLYTEGWIEFASKKTARRCAEGLNAQIVGGRKGGFYYDDIWNMKYLKGMAWSELMSGIREEKREEEGRRDEERRQIAKETKRFIEGVEDGRRIEGIKRKRSGRLGKNDTNEDGGINTNGEMKRTWRQFGVKGKPKSGSGAQNQDDVGDDVREVLGKIF